MNILINEKNRKNNNKNKKAERKGVEDEIIIKVKTLYQDYVIKNSSRYIDNKLNEELSKLMIDSFNIQINDFNETIEKIVKETMSQQSLNIMKNFNFE